MQCRICCCFLASSATTLVRINVTLDVNLRWDIKEGPSLALEETNILSVQHISHIAENENHVETGVRRNNVLARCQSACLLYLFSTVFWKMDRLPSSECIKFCLKLLDLAQLTPFALLPYAVSEPIGITIEKRSYASPRRKSYLEWEPANILLDSCCCAQIILYPVVDIVFLLIHALKEGLVLWSCTHGYYQIPTKSLISKRLSTLCRHTRRNYQSRCRCGTTQNPILHHTLETLGLELFLAPSFYSTDIRGRCAIDIKTRCTYTRVRASLVNSIWQIPRCDTTWWLSDYYYIDFSSATSVPIFLF